VTAAGCSAGGGCGPVATFFLPHAAVVAAANMTATTIVVYLISRMFFLSKDVT
jgi:hypothetical protein